MLRSVAALRGLVRPGNSGGPLVSAQGQVLATVFAALTATSKPGGFAVPNAVVQAQLAKAVAQDTDRRHGPLRLNGRGQVGSERPGRATVCVAARLRR